MDKLQQQKLVAIDLKHLVLGSDFLLDLYLVEYLIRNNKDLVFHIYVNYSNQKLVKEYLQIQSVSQRDDLDLDIKTVQIDGIEQHLINGDEKEYVKVLVEILNKQGQFKIYRDTLVILPNVKYVEIFKSMYYDGQCQLVDLNRIGPDFGCLDKNSNMLVVSDEFIWRHSRSIFDKLQIQTVIDCGYFYNTCYHSQLQINYLKCEL